MLIPILLAGLLGAAIGSFTNVVVWRVPRGASVVRPPSSCPSCGHAIRAHDNIPVVSWALLRGRCRDCRARISVRYPLVEVGTAAFFMLVTWLFGVTWTLPAFLFLAAITVALTLIDLDHHRLPDVIVLPSYPVAVGLLVLASWAPGVALVGGWGNLWRAIIGGAAFFLVYFVILLVYPGGMGFGDVKLAGVLGLYLGWIGVGALVVGWFVAFLLGGSLSIILLLSRRAGRKTKVPFGPWMLAGAWIGIVAGERVWDGYLRLVGL